jgi:putative ATP-binding cassette transporter
VKQLSIAVAIAAAIALVVGITKGDVDVLGLAADPTLLSIGAVGLTLALTTFRSSLISPFLRIFSTIFAVEYIVTGLAYIAARTGSGLQLSRNRRRPRALPSLWRSSDCSSI